MLSGDRVRDERISQNYKKEDQDMVSRKGRYFTLGSVNSALVGVTCPGQCLTLGQVLHERVSASRSGKWFKLRWELCALVSASRSGGCFALGLSFELKSWYHSEVDLPRSARSFAFRWLLYGRVGS